MTPEHRVAAAELTLLGADGAPLPEQEVVVEQVSHAFRFGNIGFEWVGDEAPAFADDWLELFNAVTLPFYWAQFEPERGRPRSAQLRAAAEWFAQRGVAVKGHPLVWHTLAPDWLLGAPPDDVESAVRARIRRDAGEFRGLLSAWDVINETVIMPVFANGDNAITPLAVARGRLGVIKMAFEEAWAADPDATLLINDFDLSESYERVLEEVLEAGVPIDAIGIQTHMHQGFRGAEQLLEIADRFATFGLPLHFTETTLVSGDLMPPHIVDLNDHVVDEWPSTPEGEARQADELEEHYRALFGHPAVESIVLWGFTDAGAWLNAPVGVVRADGSRKPSFDRLHSLIKDEWWMPPTALRTDAAGRLPVEGVRGTYRVANAGRSAEFELDGPVSVRL